MQCRRNLCIPIFGIATEEPSGSGIVVSGAEIVEAEVGVVLFAAIIGHFTTVVAVATPYQTPILLAATEMGASE